MNEEQIKSLIDQLKGAGLEDEQIMDVFYETFTKGKMDRKDLETLANALGYELTDDFKEDSTPDPIESGDADEGADLGDVSKEDLEEAKGFSEDESKEEFEEKIDDIKDEEGGDEIAKDDSEEKVEEDGEEEEADIDEDSADDDEDKEWKEANKLFKL